VPVLLVLLTLVGLRHPIHSSSAALALPEGGVTASLVLRVYGDDFPPGRDPAAIARYLGERFRITDRTGRAVPLRLEAVRVEGVVLVLTLSAPAPAGLSGARIWHGVLAERFGDQVNIVQARYGGRSASLLFTAGDGPKPLP
jgi:hypothetical protein